MVAAMDPETRRTRAAVFLVDKRLPSDAQKRIFTRVRQIMHNEEANVAVRCWPSPSENEEAAAARSPGLGGAGRSDWRDFDSVSSLTEGLAGYDVVDFVWFAHKVSGKAPIPVEELHAYALLKEARNTFPRSVRRLVTSQRSDSVDHWAGVLGLARVRLDSEKELDALFAEFTSEVLWRGDLKLGRGVSRGDADRLGATVDFVGVTEEWKGGRAPMEGEARPPEASGSGDGKGEGSALVGSPLPRVLGLALDGPLLAEEVIPLAWLPLHRLKSVLARVRVVVRDRGIQSWLDRLGRVGEDPEARAWGPAMCIMLSQLNRGAPLALVPAGSAGGGVFSLVELVSAAEDAILPQLQPCCPSGAESLGQAADKVAEEHAMIVDYVLGGRQGDDWGPLELRQRWPELFALEGECTRKGGRAALALARAARKGKGPGKKIASSSLKEKLAQVEKYLNQDGTLKVKPAATTAAAPRKLGRQAQGFLAQQGAALASAGGSLSPRSKLSLGWVYERRRQLQLASLGGARRDGHGVSYYRGERPKPEKRRRAVVAPAKKEKAASGVVRKRKEQPRPKPGAAKGTEAASKFLKKVKVRRTLDYTGAL